MSYSQYIHVIVWVLYILEASFGTRYSILSIFFYDTQEILEYKIFSTLSIRKKLFKYYLSSAGWLYLSIYLSIYHRAVGDQGSLQSALVTNCPITGSSRADGDRKLTWECWRYQYKEVRNLPWARLHDTQLGLTSS